MRTYLSALVLFLCSVFAHAEQSRLSILFDRAQIGDRAEVVEAIFGKPDAVSTTSVLGVTKTTYVYTDLLQGQTIRLHLCLGRLVSKTLDSKPLLFPTP